MKEFIDKLIGRLEELKELHAELIKDGLEEDYHSGCEGMCVDIIEIVNQLAEEYINCSTDISTNKSDISTISKMENVGWIPCERELPEADHYVLCQGNNSMFVACIDGFDGEWRDNHFYKRTNVKAWSELPAPYTEGE